MTARTFNTGLFPYYGASVSSIIPTGSGTTFVIPENGQGEVADHREARYSLKPGNEKKLTVRLKKSGRKLLLQMRKLSAKPDKGKAKTVRRTFTLPKKKPAHKRHPKH